MNAGTLSAHRLVQRALSLGGAKSFEYVAQFLLPVVLARTLDTTTFGEYRLLWLAVGTVMPIVVLGVPMGLFYFLPRAAPAERRLYVHQTILYLAVAGLVGAWAVSPWDPWQPAALAPLDRFGPLVPAFVLLWITASLLDSLPTVDERTGWQAKVTIALAAVRAALLAGAAILTHGLEALLAMLLVVAILKLALLLDYVVRHHGLRGGWLRASALGAHLRLTVPFGASGALYSMRGQGDQWIAASLFAIHNFAAFSVASVLGPMMHVFRQSVSEAFLPVMSRMQAGGDPRAMLELNARANLMIGALVLPLLAFAFVFAPDVVRLVYTSAYLGAAPVMRVYIFGLLASVIELWGLMLLLKQGGFALGNNAFLLAVSVTVSFAGAKMFGLPGAAAGSVAAVWLDRMITLRRISRLTGVPVRRMQRWGSLALLALLAAGAAALAHAAAELLIPAAPALERLALGGAVLAAAYAPLPLASRIGGWR